MNIALRFVGGDAYIPGAPARDLTDDDLALFGLDADGLVASGLYARPLIDQPDAQPTNKPARKGKGA